MASTKTGLVSFIGSSNHPDLVIRGALTSSANDESGIGAWGELVGATYDFNEDGMDPNGSKGLQYRLDDNTPDFTVFNNGGYIHIEPTVDWNKDNPSAATKYWISKSQGWCEGSDTNGEQKYSMDNSGNKPDQIDISPTGKDGSHYDFDISWDGTNIDYYTDGLHLGRQILAVAGVWAGTWNDMYVGGLTGVASDYDGKREKNFFLLDKPQDFTPTERILWLGDSFTTQGGVPDFVAPVTALGEDLPWAPQTLSGVGGTNYGNGFDSSDNYAGLSVFRDAGYVCTVVRQLSKAGIFTSNNANYAKSGGTAAEAQAKFTQALADGFSPTIVNSGLGTNDALGGITPIATFEANYKALITDAYNNNVKTFVLWTIPSGNPDSSWRSQTYIDSVDDVNDVIRSLISWSIDQGYGSGFLKLADAFTATGGHNFNPLMFQNQGETTEVSITDGGTGYTVNDVIELVGGTGTGAQLKVTSVGAANTITGATFSGVSQGSGYTDGFTATVTGGTGNDDAIFEVNVGNIHPNELGSNTLGLQMSAASLEPPSTGTGIMQPIMASGY